MQHCAAISAIDELLSKQVTDRLSDRKCQDNFSQSHVARLLNVSQSCISKFLQRRNCRSMLKIRPKWQTTKVRQQKRSTSHSLCEVSHKTNIKRGYKHTESNTASTTVRRRLRSYGFRRKIRKTIVISRVNRVRRVSWCRQKLTSWNVKIAAGDIF